MRIVRLACGLVAGLLITAPAVKGARLQVPLTGTDVITNEGGDARVLMTFGPLDLPAGRAIWVSTAYLDVPLSGERLTRRIEVQAYAVSTAWTRGTATWTSPWRTPGGDVEGDVPYVEMDEASDPSGIAIEVTSLVESALRTGAGEARLMLTVPAGRGEGFSAADRAALGQLSGATLNIVYVHAGPRESAITPRG